MSEMYVTTVEGFSYIIVPGSQIIVGKPGKAVKIGVETITAVKEIKINRQAGTRYRRPNSRLRMINGKHFLDVMETQEEIIEFIRKSE